MTGVEPLTARRLDALEPLAAAGCRTLRLDVTDDESMRTAVETIEAEHGAIDVLVNNAGIARSEIAAEDMEDERGPPLRSHLAEQPVEDREPLAGGHRPLGPGKVSGQLALLGQRNRGRGPAPDGVHRDTHGDARQPGGEQRVAAEVGDQDLDGDLRVSHTESPDRLGEVRRAAVCKVVAVDGRDDRVRELELGLSLI